MVSKKRFHDRLLESYRKLEEAFVNEVFKDAPPGVGERAFHKVMKDRAEFRGQSQTLWNIAFLDASKSSAFVGEIDDQVATYFKRVGIPVVEHPTAHFMMGAWQDLRPEFDFDEIEEEMQDAVIRMSDNVDQYCCCGNFKTMETRYVPNRMHRLTYNDKERRHEFVVGGNCCVYGQMADFRDHGMRIGSFTNPKSVYILGITDMLESNPMRPGYGGSTDVPLNPQNESFIRRLDTHKFGKLVVKNATNLNLSNK